MPSHSFTLALNAEENHLLRACAAFLEKTPEEYLLAALRSRMSETADEICQEYRLVEVD